MELLCDIVSGQGWSLVCPGQCEARQGHQQGAGEHGPGAGGSLGPGLGWWGVSGVLACPNTFSSSVSSVAPAWAGVLSSHEFSLSQSLNHHSLSLTHLSLVQSGEVERFIHTDEIMIDEYNSYIVGYQATCTHKVVSWGPNYGL